MTFLLLGEILIYLVVLATGFILLRRCVRKRWPAWVWISTLLVWPVIDLTIPQIILARNCNDVGMQIYKTVENVEGVYLANENGCGAICEELLFDEKGGTYAFVEASAQYDTHTNFVSGPGLYRFSKANKGSGECRFFDEYIKKYEIKHAYDKYLYCIVPYNINTISAKYTNAREIKNKSLFFGNLIIDVISIYENVSNEYVFINKSYMFESMLLWSRFFNNYSCDKLAEYVGVREVLLPFDVENNRTGK